MHESGKAKEHFCQLSNKQQQHTTYIISYFFNLDLYSPLLGRSFPVWRSGFIAVFVLVIKSHFLWIPSAWQKLFAREITDIDWWSTCWSLTHAQLRGGRQEKCLPAASSDFFSSTAINLRDINVLTQFYPHSHASLIARSPRGSVLSAEDSKVLNPGHNIIAQSIFSLS